MISDWNSDKTHVVIYLTYYLRCHIRFFFTSYVSASHSADICFHFCCACVWAQVVCCSARESCTWPMCHTLGKSGHDLISPWVSVITSCESIQAAAHELMPPAPSSVCVCMCKPDYDHDYDIFQIIIVIYVSCLGQNNAVLTHISCWIYV